MLTFEFLNARHGDCFLMRWGEPNPRTMLVDGGPSDVYEAVLRDRLLQLPNDQHGVPQINVVCLTHVDDDHVVGVMRLLAEVRRARRDQLPDPFAVRRLWFNSVDDLIDVAAPGLSASVAPLFSQAVASSSVVAASFNQGRAVRDDAVALGLVGNKPFNAPLLQGASASVDGLDVTVVAPDTPALDKLASRWKKAKKKKDPSVITASYTDGSIPNLSSIVLLVRQGGRSALLTGDARGDRVLAGLRASSLLDPEPVHVRLLKLPHHGSERNVTPDFFQSITADHYVVSADGIKHHHPHEDTLRSLVESRAVRDEYVVHLTNPVPFALNVLHELHVGRRFSVNVRAETDSGVVIEL